MKKYAVFTTIILAGCITDTIGQNNTFPLPSGNVGIGTTSAPAKLTINSPNGSHVNIQFSQGETEKASVGVAGGNNEFFVGAAANWILRSKFTTISAQSVPPGEGLLQLM